MCVGSCARALNRIRGVGLLSRLEPCGHEGVCTQCAPHLVDVVGEVLRCPLCREPAKEVWRVAGGGLAEAMLFEVNGSAVAYARQLQYEHHVAAVRHVAALKQQRQKEKKKADAERWRAAVAEKEQALAQWLLQSDVEVRACFRSIGGAYVPDREVDACLERAPASLAELVEAWDDRDMKKYLRRVVRRHMGWKF